MNHFIFFSFYITLFSFPFNEVSSLKLKNSPLLLHHTQDLSSFPFYHSTQQIDAFLDNLHNICFSNTSVIIHHNNDISYLKSYDISLIDDDNEHKDNIFLLSGEHARELISSEFLFNFTVSLCIDYKFNSLLKKNNFRIIINANPLSRINVEKGNFKLRVNENGVDLNRNWDYLWKPSKTKDDTFPGKVPFTEIETKFIRDSLSNFHSKMFLTLHSGFKAFLMPYASKGDNITNKTNYNKMMELLKEIKTNYFPEYKIGPLSQVYEKMNYGNCLDYAYDVMKIPYSLAWEIYQGKEIKADNNKENLKNFNPIDETTFYSIIKRFKDALYSAIEIVNRN